MIFSDSPSQKALERMMTQVKGFPPRDSGVMVLRRFEYTAEMCDCRLCLYYNRKKKCTGSQCPCIEERIIAGAADRSEVMAETMKNIHNAAFHRRLNQFINESEEADSFLQVKSSYITQPSPKVSLSMPPFLPNSFSPMG